MSWPGHMCVLASGWQFGGGGTPRPTWFRGAGRLPRGQGLGLLPLLLHELRGARESRVGKPDLQFITSSIQMLRIKN